MVELTLEPQMLDILAKAKGKTFKSYEGVFPIQRPIISHFARINLGSFSVDLECWYKEVDNWREADEFEPPCVLSCYERPPGEPFPEAPSDRLFAILVGERVTGVEVVRFTMRERGELDARMDAAIAVRTKSAVYTFSRGASFDTSIYVAEGEGVELAYAEEKCAQGWQHEPNEDGSPSIEVTRTIISL